MIIYIKMSGCVKTFLHWIFMKRNDTTPVGDLARDALADPEWDGTQRHLASILQKKEKDIAYDKAMDALSDCIEQYREYNKGVRKVPLVKKRVVPKEKENKE